MFSLCSSNAFKQLEHYSRTSSIYYFNENQEINPHKQPKHCRNLHYTSLFGHFLNTFSCRRKYLSGSPDQNFNWTNKVSQAADDLKQAQIKIICVQIGEATSGDVAKVRSISPLVFAQTDIEGMLGALLDMCAETCSNGKLYDSSFCFWFYFFGRLSTKGFVAFYFRRYKTATLTFAYDNPAATTTNFPSSYTRTPSRTSTRKSTCTISYASNSAGWVMSGSTVYLPFGLHLCGSLPNLCPSFVHNAC